MVVLSSRIASYKRQIMRTQGNTQEMSAPNYLVLIVTVKRMVTVK